ncbi:RNA polymerase sigma factor [Luteitalea sp. TBR-22]|uniref:RNA polymerase sigma factor n=1 Tax=Luteitalea sp. TBR-22 TaxID=2802971 RepID=UPI001EF551FF|nr:RNA polymerase sigma factor [Luteitalea sp. TBR-22]
MTDEDLVARAQGGSQDAWAALVQRHHGAVFRAAHAALLSHEEADDAAQEAWISAWKALGDFRGQAAFRTWVVAIAWRKALDRRRGMVGWMRMLRIGVARDEEEGPELDLEGDQPDAERALLDDEARGRLKRLVKGLPRAHRDALLLVATQDVPYAEAAALLGIPVGTLKWRVSDARRMLRERMGR